MSDLAYWFSACPYFRAFKISVYSKLQCCTPDSWTQLFWNYHIYIYIFYCNVSCTKKKSIKTVISWKCCKELLCKGWGNDGWKNMIILQRKLLLTVLTYRQIVIFQARVVCSVLRVQQEKILSPDRDIRRPERCNEAGSSLAWTNKNLHETFSGQHIIQSEL